MPAAVPSGAVPSSPSSKVKLVLWRCDVWAFRYLAIAHVRYDEQSDKLYPSVALFERPPSYPAAVSLRVLELLCLVRLERSPNGVAGSNKGQIISTTNLTIINVLLVTFGPMHEQMLCSLMAGVQVAGSVLAFGVRYGVGSWFYGGDRR